MAVGFRIDNETLALTVVVGAGLLYYFTRDMETLKEQRERRNNDRKGIATVNLNTLEHRYDDLNLEDQNPDKPLLPLIEAQLNSICEDTLRLQSTSNDIRGMKEEFFEHTQYLIRSCREHLEKSAEAQADIDAQKDQAKDTCPTQNIAHVTNTTHVHNHFDMRQHLQHLSHWNQIHNDQRKILQNQQNIDASGQHFLQQNTEMRTLQLRNPHCETRNADMLPVGGHSAPSMLSHHTCEGTSNASVLDQQQQAKDNVVVKTAVATCVPGARVAHKPTAAQVVKTTDAMSDLSSAKSRHSAELRDRIGALVGAAVKHGSVHEVDIFTSAPQVPSDNHDKPPGDNPVPPTESEQAATKPLGELSSNERQYYTQAEYKAAHQLVKYKDRSVAVYKPPLQGDMYNKGVKRKAGGPRLGPPMAKKPKIPPSPAALREEAKVRKRAARIEIGEFSARIGQELDKLRGATMYHRAAVGGIETLIRGLDKAMDIAGTAGQKEMYTSTLRVGYIDRVNKHKRRFHIKVV